MMMHVARASEDPETLPRLPGWITSVHAETPEDVTFLSGAALACLSLVVALPDLPHRLWRARLALAAAEVCVGFAGRPERAAGLRDAVHLLRPGENPGPAGVVFQVWQRAVTRPLSVAGLAPVLPGLGESRIALALKVSGGTPVAQAARVIEAVLADQPRAETEALILADAVLGRALGAERLVPLLALGLKRRDLRTGGDALQLACGRAVFAAVGRALPLATDLARRVAFLQAVAPKIRTRRAEEAVALFLERDAVAPAALSGLMSDRAARRFCDRLVVLGAARELTGRDTFRLYGI